MKTTRLVMGSVALAMTLASTTNAQWTDDSTMHQVVADGAGEQVQPKIIATFDGGCYVSWFSSTTGYDVRIQRLDAEGNEMWAHNGVLVADRNFSSTQDYGLALDTTNHAILVFRDDRFGGTKITVQRIAPDGSTPWGPNGFQFGNGTDFVASPDVATTDDDFSVIGWINNNDMHMAKISTAGMHMWTKVFTDPGGQSMNLASMHRSDGNNIIASWVQSGAFFDPKHLYAQKIDRDGNEAWPSRVAVFDGGSLQFGNFPEFVPDISGGAVFSWYDTANGLNVFTQRLDSNGAELFPHNGVAASTNPRERVSPTAAYDWATDSVYVAWTELDNNQGSQGIYAQRIDATGTRQWTNAGKQLSVVDANESGSINAQVVGGNMVAMWIENAGGFGQDQVLAHAVTPAGTDAWVGGTVAIASDLALRSRLTSALSSDGFAIAGWQIGDFGVADIQTHNINPDGSLGVDACPADLTGDGILDFFDIAAFLTAFTNMDPVADFNGDTQLDFFDIAAYLSAFSAGCP